MNYKNELRKSSNLIGQALRTFDFSEIESASLLHDFDSVGIGVFNLSTWYCEVCGALIGYSLWQVKYCSHECRRLVIDAMAARNRSIFIAKYRLLHKPQEFYRGENSPAARLTESAVLDIRNNYTGKPGASCYSFAAKYDVTYGAIKLVVDGATWRHVGGPTRYDYSRPMLIGLKPADRQDAGRE